MFRAAAFALALLPAAPALAQEGDPALTVSDPVIRAATPMAKTAAGYLTITNKGDTAYDLTGIEAGFPTAELHESLLDGDVMRMEPRPDGFEIAPGQTLTLEPGGKHVMFMGIDRRLAEGQEIPATLVFTDEVRLPVTFVVTVPDAMGHEGMDHGGSTSGDG